MLRAHPVPAARRVPRSESDEICSTDSSVRSTGVGRRNSSFFDADQVHRGPERRPSSTFPENGATADGSTELGKAIPVELFDAVQRASGYALRGSDTEPETRRSGRRAYPHGGVASEDRASIWVPDQLESAMDPGLPLGSYPTNHVLFQSEAEHDCAVVIPTGPRKAPGQSES